MDRASPRSRTSLRLTELRAGANLLAAAVLLAGTACSSPPPSTGTTAGGGVASASVVPSAAAAAASASAAARGPADDGGDTPPCARSKVPGYGDWKPKPDEVLAAVAALDVSAVPHGFAKRLGDCMQQEVEPYVEVMVEDDSPPTENAMVMQSWFTTGSVEWNGRRFITLDHVARMGPTFVNTMDAVELTPRGPVQVIDTCQEDPGSTLGPRPCSLVVPRSRLRSSADAQRPEDGHATPRTATPRTSSRPPSAGLDRGRSF